MPKRRNARSLAHSQLHKVVQDAHLLAGLERREADVGARGAAEGVAEGAVVARARLALDGKVELVEVVFVEAQRAEARVGLGAALLVLGLELGGEAAGAVLAGPAPLLGLAVCGCAGVSVRCQRRVNRCKRGTDVGWAAA